MFGMSSTLQLPGLSISIGGGPGEYRPFQPYDPNGCGIRPPSRPPCHPHPHHRPHHGGHHCHSSFNFFNRLFGGMHTCMGQPQGRPPHPLPQQGQGGFGFFMAGVVF